MVAFKFELVISSLFVALYCLFEVLHKQVINGLMMHKSCSTDTFPKKVDMGIGFCLYKLLNK